MLINHRPQGGCVALHAAEHRKHLRGEEDVAVGTTPDNLRATLSKLYAPKLKKLELTVIVRNFRNPKVYVGGEVAVPGVLEMENELSITQAIMQAGGFRKQSAELSSVLVLRSIDGKRRALSVDLEKALGGEEKPPFQLEPFDIVYVPRTTIDKVDQWVEQHLELIIPHAIMLTFDKSI